VRLGTAASLDVILAEAPDVVVIATGARPVLPDAAGLAEAMKNGFAVTIDQAMSRTKKFEPGQHPVVYGSGIGGELAIDFYMRGLDVRVMEPAAGFNPVNYLGSRTPRVQGLMQAYKIPLEVDAKLVRVGDGEIEVENSAGHRKVVACSSLVIALGRQPNNELVAALQGHKIKVQVLGDAKKPRSYGNAIHEAAYLARNI
jgi:pyruvate/2-oxoglutarate dehydrogenase complex dihydrolipoamide dehydrogenase (E3) component